ncbi:DMT family transporter [Pandoraea oxalativorans]|uniref:Multidrug DMT transporter n=1 Tax=Pandoraea oxalativorans TaxID=573737 RepID=A0A0E3U6Z3_9BURK|nr:DMT family transporter [Pandoraea oxalativorans]AKC70419.1 multidrug DMT transporter [Pandoraea oxalativorans]
MNPGYLFLCLLAVCIWAGNAIVVKLAAGAIPPGVIAFDRWFVAFVALTPFVATHVWRHRSTIRTHLPKLALMGLLGMAACQGIAYYAAGFTSATNIGILLSLVPMLTLLLGATLFRDVPSRRAMLGVAISFAGILLVIGKGDPRILLSQGVGHGDLLMLVAALSIAGYGILLKRWANLLPTFTSLYVQMAFALVFLMPGFLLEPAMTYSAPNVAMVLYAAIPGSIIAPYAWMLTVGHLGANRASIFMNLIPVFTAIGAALALHETLHAYHLLGGGLTIFGVALSQTRQRRMPHDGAPDTTAIAVER